MIVKWQPIETAPKDGTQFLAWYPRDPDFIEITCWIDLPREANADSWTLGGIDPTHWTPLPEPPE